MRKESISFFKSPTSVGICRQLLIPCFAFRSDPFQSDHTFSKLSNLAIIGMSCFKKIAACCSLSSFSSFSLSDVCSGGTISGILSEIMAGITVGIISGTRVSVSSEDCLEVSQTSLNNSKLFLYYKFLSSTGY